MDKKSFKQYVDYEIFRPYRESKKRMSIFDKIWCKYFNPELNAVYLIRKKQLLESGGKISKILSRFYHVKLMRRYGIHITPGTVIGKGLRIAHPTSIVVTLCTIGENFTIYQNCTIGQKFWKSEQFPTIGDNVTMYAGSSIIGAVKISDGVTLGANSLLLKDTSTGVYCGSPAMRISPKNENF